MDSLSEDTVERITREIRTLETNPRPRGTKKLLPSGEFRIRVGDYRILYRVSDESRRVEIISVAHRRDAYRH